MKSILSLFVVLLSSYVVVAEKPQIEHESLDSVLQWLDNNVETDTTYSHKIGLNGLKRAYADGDPKVIADYHEMLAYWHDYHQKFHSDSVVYHYEKALYFYQLTGDSIIMANSYLDLATAYMNNDQLEQARVQTFAGVELIERIGSDQDLIGAYNSLANLHLLTTEWDDCIFYGRKSYDLAKKNADHLHTINSSIGLLDCLLENQAFKESHDIAKLSFDLTAEYYPSQLGFTVRSLERMSIASSGLKQWDRAMAEATKAWDIAKNAVGEIQAAGHRISVGDVLYKQGKYAEALEVYNFIIPHKEDRAELWPIYEKIAVCQEHLKQYELALVNRKEASVRKEKMLEDKMAKLKSESFIKYETGKKDQEIASQKVQLTQQKKIQYLSIGVAGLLSLLLASLLYVFRKNRSFTQSLKNKNKENELLLKEIHHRVKNNLETVSSLLTLQGAQIEDEKAQNAIQASQNRVLAMGILHQKLYQKENLGAIEMKDYFINLSEGVLETFEQESQVKIECQMDRLELDIDTALPIGLIVNELLTNALKYAFPPDFEARINISLEEIDADQLLLKIKDNGVGADFSKAPKGTGFGTQLVNLLTRQLRGTIDRTIDNGTIVSLILKKSQAA